MNETPSLLSQHQLDYEQDDDSEVRKALGQWKRKLREVVANDKSPAVVNEALRRIFKSK